MTTTTDRYNGLVGSVAIKPPVKVATTTNITLSGLQTIDGVTVVENDRVLVKNQTNSVENGIYLASSTSWSRATDFNGAYDAAFGTLVSIASGTQNANTQYSLNTENPALGVSNISFKQIILKDTVNIEDYGAVGDGVTDDSSALVAAVNTGKVVHLDGSKSYNFATIPNFVDQSVRVRLNGALIQLSDNSACIHAKANITDVYAVTSHANNVVLDLNGDTGSVDSEVTQINILSAAAYQVNDLVKIVSDDLIPEEDTGERRKIGEFIRVSEVGATYIKTYSRLKNTYTTNVRIGRVNPNNYVFDVRDVRVAGQISPDPSWSRPAFNVEGFINPIITAQENKNLVERAVRFVSCYKPYTENINAYTVRTDFDNDAFGYTIQEVGCEAGVHMAPQGTNVRSVYTCSAAETDDLGDLLNYGQTWFSKVIGGHGKNNTAYSFSTHADAVGVEFHGCTVESAYWGKHGTAGGIGFRGKNCKANNCSVIGGSGFRAYTDFASSINSKGHEFNNCTYTYHPNEDNDKRALSVIGKDGHPIGSIRAHNFTVKGYTGHNPIFEANYGNLVIDGYTIEAPYTTTDTARIFEVNDDQSSIKAYNGFLDLTDATGTGLRLARFVGGNNDADATSGRVEIDGLEITADNKLDYLADLRNKNGTFIAKNINTTHKTTGTTDGLVNENNGTCFVDWKENDGRTDVLAHFGGGSFIGGTHSIDIGKRYADHLYARVLVSTTDATINEITQGNKLGQKLTIFLRSSSTANLIIDGDGTNIDIGADYTIGPGKAVTLMWANSDGTNNNWIFVG